MKIQTHPALIVGVCALVLAAQRSAYAHATAPEPLRRFVEEALATHPEVEAASARVRQAEALARAASQPLYNPELELEYQDAEVTEKTLGLSQAIDWTGKRTARGQAGAAEAGAVAAEAQAATARVTPRIAAQIVARHARLGEAVEPGDPLATLSSVVMAEAQGVLIETAAEWQRVQTLGREVVSDKRFTEAQVAFQKAQAALRAYGMSADVMQALLESGGAAKADGEFVLAAPIAGTVIFDDFVLGEFVEPGRVLFAVSDESRLWVEASLTPHDAAQVRRGDTAWVVRGDRRLEATVIQIHHMLSETTRRQKVRLEVSNAEDLLHPGEFVDALLPTGSADPVLAAPSTAVTLLDGVATVFAWDGDEFIPVAIETGIEAGEWIAVDSGLEAGQEIAFTGVFHLKSLLLRSKLGEGHAH